MEVKAAGAKADILPLSCAVVPKSRNLNFLEPSEPVQACNGTALSEDWDILDVNAVSPGEQFPPFRRMLVPPSSWWSSPEDGGTKLLRKVGNYLASDTA